MRLVKLFPYDALPISLLFSLFFFNDTATTEIYTLSLHDALPICKQWAAKVFPDLPEEEQVDALWDQIFKTTRV